MASSADAEPEAGKRDWQEALVAALLVLAALGTSWSSYQATRWNGEQAKAASRTSAIRIQAATEASLADSQTQIDVATFIAWADADQVGDATLADFYVERFRDEFKPAYDAWVATDPLKNPDAPPTPFAMPEYRLASQAKADDLNAQAELSAATVRRDIQRSSNYVLSVVLYAVVLFFAGMTTRLRHRRVRWVMLGCGCFVLAATISWILTFPVSVSV